MIALSTVYNISKHSDSSALVDEIKSLGFFAVELNVEVPEKFISEISKKIKIVSVHNFCPKLDSIPAGKTIYSAYSFASNDENERKTAVKLTKKTIDVASNVGSKAIVVHSGEVEMDISGRLLAKKYNETKGKNGYGEFLQIFLNERKLKSKMFLENVVKSVDEILNYAVKKNIKIGIENRFWANEIPSLGDYEILLNEFDTDLVGLWYDVGHSIIAEKQGLVKSHLDFLERFSDRIIGMHLHDVVDVYDHRAPGTGEVDFSEIASYVKDDTILVNETHSASGKDDLKNSIDYLKNHGF